MSTPVLCLCGLVLGMSGLAFCLMGYDKNRAKRGGRRIPERTLWLVALLGGGPGAAAGMWAFRHKTRHRAFAVGFPLLGLGQLALLARLYLGG